MDPAEIMSVRFHFGGEFIHIGKELDYVGGDEKISEIEREKMSMQEVIGFLKDHMEVKDSVKLYFLPPGKELVNGLVFLYDDARCVNMSEQITDGRVVDIYVEYHAEQDMVSISSGSDFEDEIVSLGDNDESEVPEVITAEDEVAETITVDVDENVPVVDVDQIEPEAMVDNVLVPDENGAITQVMTSPGKRIRGRTIVLESSQVMAGSAQVINPSHHSQVPNTVCQDFVPRDAGTSEERGEDYSESEEDSDYVAHSDDSGEESEVLDMRKKAKQFKSKMRASHRWVEGENATGAVPIDLVANVEEVLEDINKEAEFESSGEDYSYDEEEDGNLVRRKSRYPKFDSESEVPHFCLSMVFRSKIQLVNAVKRYGLVTKRSLSFKKSEVDRVRVKCDWPNCPWLLYAAKTTRCSRFQIITFDDEHHCAQNRDNHLVTAKVIAKKYEHFILANPTWKIESMKSTVLQDFFADVSTSKCKAAKKIIMDKLLCGMKGEYNKVFDYQLELLRSNPGTTVAICLDPTIMEQNIFQSFYVCFNALKLGFKAGCRKVI
ncbi:hypothetical protein QYE76_005339 [Lolium multiflorum]|uniref:PB1-like domain-containing protein n=1 Tax=Lolium multiflorum TaxID=4521 RepID=A0AAD8W261_LOLMU|nr:hypothetical protein QYE76_005339 [Lolium multiflorum]